MLSGGAGHYRAEECDHDTIASLVRIYTFYTRLTTATGSRLHSLCFSLQMEGEILLASEIPAPRVCPPVLSLNSSP